ncbi:MAG: glycoside hydrolase family 43 protein [Bacteroidales bacterium]|jgi:beta-xylosidase|nr:glycoside hydrolase family 43 protein [Bacteroidales bacterium]
MKSSIFLILFSLFPFLAYSQEATYRNPVIPGDLPDPTVIRAGDTYYAAGTSSEWAPPYRLYESKDLVNWTYLGAVFQEMPAWTMGSYWAPELFYRNGTYFLYYTARRRSDRKSFIGVATARDIRQGFTDHGLLVEWTSEAIDAFVIELDGKLYISWKAYGLDKGKSIEILGSELTDNGLKLKGEAFRMLQADAGSWEAGGMEGQCLVRHGDYIYMFYAGNSCCGPNCNYQTGVARARDIRGPWEKYAGNPILHSDGQWRCPGHGTIMTTPAGRYFYLYHAYNAATNVYTGRQGMMDEVVWDAATGWPSFRYGATPSVQAAAPDIATVQHPVADFTDGFDAAEASVEWMWDASQSKPDCRVHGGKLTLTGKDSPVGAFLGLRPRKDSYTLQATVEKGVSPAGICIYGTKEQAMGLSRTGNRVELWQVEKGIRSVLATAELQENTEPILYLETRFGQYCRFGYLQKDGQQKQVGTLLHVGSLLQWDRAPMIGIQAGSGKGVFDAVKILYR